jgi:hypothetical protein
MECSNHRDYKPDPIESPSGCLQCLKIWLETFPAQHIHARDLLPMLTSIEARIMIAEVHLAQLDRRTFNTQVAMSSEYGPDGGVQPGPEPGLRE